MRRHGLLIALVLSLGVTPVGAQDAEVPQEARQEQKGIVELEGVRVLGSRHTARSARDSLVPVDVIQREDLQTYGIRDMDTLLSATVPSYNVNRRAPATRPCWSARPICVGCHPTPHWCWSTASAGIAPR